MSVILPNRNWEQLKLAQEETGLIEADWRSDTIRMCDLVTREPLRPGEIPGSMKEGEYGAGFENLQRFAEEYGVRLEIILNNHGGLRDHERLLEDHEETLRVANLACIEMNTLYGNAHDLLLEEALQPGFDGASEGHIEYTKSQLATCEEFGITAMPIDIDVSPTCVVQEALVDACKKMEGKPPEVDLALYGAYQNSRQYAFLAKIGMWLSQLESQRPHLLAQDMNIALMLGSYHTAVADKARDLGIEVNAPVTRDQIDNQDSPVFRASYKMTHDAAIDYDTLIRGAA